MITKEIFECKRDGKTIRGFVYRDDAKAVAPLAIVSHGFLANYYTTRKYAQWLAGHGYVAVCFDFIGGGVFCHSDGKLRDMSVLTEIEDLKCVIEHARNLGFDDGAPVTLWGCSQGGFVSGAVAAALGSGVVGKLILFYPALCITDDANAGKMIFYKFDPANVPDTIGFWPMRIGRRYVEDVRDIDQIAMISRYDGDVLLVHGDADNIVPYRYAQMADEAFAKRASGSCRLFTVMGAPHGFGKKIDKVVLPEVASFLGV